MRPGTQTAFRDVTLSFALVLAVIFLLPHLPKKSELDAETKSPGTITGEILWPQEMPVDVDLWFRGPDGVNVGYNNLGGPLANLLRDDLGHVWDLLPINYEIIATRGAPPGEYQFSIYYFRGDISPVPVEFVVTKKTSPSDTTVLFRKTAQLKFMTQEITLVRFELNAKGELIYESVNEIHRPIARARILGGPDYNEGTP